MGGDIYSIVNDFAVHCFFSLKFGTYFDHVTADTTNVQGQRVKVNVTAWRNVSAEKR